MAAPDQGSGGGLSTAIPRKYRGMAAAASRASGVPLKVVAAQIDDESGWDPTAVSSAGAEGIAQFEPGTWQTWGHGSPFVPADAFPAYGRFMGSLVKQNNGSLRDALAAYNAGEGDLSAGYGYADRILSAAGEGEGAKGGGPPNPYRDPFRGIRVTPERIDMGVDYSAPEGGGVYALGPGIITEAATGTGWGPPAGSAPGGFIGERLTAGPLAGHDIYIAEGIYPKVRTGQHVTADTIVGDMVAGGTGIETGFAAPPGTGTPLAAALHQQAPGSDPGAWPTAVGVAYSDVLHLAGAPRGIGPTTGGHGTDPGWLASALKNWGTGAGGGIKGGGGGGLLGGLFGDIGSGISDIGSALGSIAQALQDVETAVAWLFVPNHWIRIFAGVFGTGFLFWGIFLMARTGRPYTATVPGVGQVPAVGGEIAPAMGIALVTLGAILLFIAFHNLPAGVTDFPSLMAHLQAEAQSGGTSG